MFSVWLKVCSNFGVQQKVSHENFHWGFRASLNETATPISNYHALFSMTLTFIWPITTENFSLFQCASQCSVALQQKHYFFCVSVLFDVFSVLHVQWSLEHCYSICQSGWVWGWLMEERKASLVSMFPDVCQWSKTCGAILIRQGCSFVVPYPWWHHGVWACAQVNMSGSRSTVTQSLQPKAQKLVWIPFFLTLNTSISFHVTWLQVQAHSSCL